jgi:hypothetical protein
LIISAMALTVSLSAGGAYAATVIGTAQLKNSSVTSAKIKDKTITTKDLSAAARKALKGATGPAGTPGAPGAAGAPGATGTPGTSATALWAVVKTSGIISRGSGTTGSVRDSIGKFTVTFNRDVSGCAYLADIGLEAPGALPVGYTSVVPAPASNAVTVRTGDKNGDLADLTFHLAVFC